MEKIATVFVRDPDNRKHVLNEVTEGCEWVFEDPEAVPTRKWDGTCVKVENDYYDGHRAAIWVRREVKPGKQPPPNFVEISTDPTTGKTMGWEPYDQSGFAKFILEALETYPTPDNIPDGTYELIGPKIQGNPENADHHMLVPHGKKVLSDVPSTFAGLRTYLKLMAPMEGIVWWHPDGRRAKLKLRDFPA